MKKHALVTQIATLKLVVLSLLAGASAFAGGEGRMDALAMKREFQVVGQTRVVEATPVETDSPIQKQETEKGTRPLKSLTSQKD